LPLVKLKTKDRRATFGEYQSIVIATGRRSNNELNVMLESCSLPLQVFTVGDASSPRTALEAIHEAAQLAAII
jgi:hypothetical protein